jgi:CDP-diacylglycerol--serine O-phosphatidyltransferase
MKKKVNFLPNVITAFGLCCGLFAIFKMSMIPAGEATPELLLVTAQILLLAAFADLLDGAVARAIKAESQFGGQFDSMADAVTFGVAPAVVVLKSLSVTPGTDLSFLLTAGAMVYTVCGILRLVRFNLNKDSISNDLELIEASKKNFTGLPIPAAASAIISGNLFLASNEFSGLFTISHESKACILFAQLIIIGYFMISRWKFPSLKKLHIKINSFRRVFLVVLFTVFFIFYGLIKHFTLVFVLVSWGYIIVALTLSLIRIASGKKSKTLEDFEPAPEEDLLLEDDEEK